MMMTLVKTYLTITRTLVYEVMRTVLLLGLLVLLTGCGVPRLVYDSEIEVAAQANADLNEVTSFLFEEGKHTDNQTLVYAAIAIKGHAANMAKAMSIAPDELPVARISKRDWLTNPEWAGAKSEEYIKTDTTTLESVATKGIAGAALLALILRTGYIALKTHPIGQLLGQLATVFGYNSPIKDKVHTKIIKALETYKDKDPQWRTNTVFVHLSSCLTEPEKTYIKDTRDVV